MKGTEDLTRPKTALIFDFRLAIFEGAVYQMIVGGHGVHFKLSLGRAAGRLCTRFCQKVDGGFCLATPYP